MDSSAPLADIEERFFHCSVCLCPFTDPKLLPCLHRYCRGCLKDIIAQEIDSFKCPLCQEECDIPLDGIDGFKSDFHIRSVVDFLQLQTSFEQDDTKKCHGCSKKIKVMAYCFKCRNFLCNQCYQFHLSNEMVAEHRPHVINLEKVDLRSLTLEKLASLTEHPRCTTHVKHLTDLSCATCSNLPICLVCTYGDHKGHNINDIKKLARSEREKLKTILSELNKYKEKLYKVPQRLEHVTQKLRANVQEKLDKAKSGHRRAAEEVSRKAEENMIKLEQTKTDIKNRKEKDFNQVKQECDKGLEKVRQRYNGILKEKEQKYDKETKQVEEKHGKIDDVFGAKLEKFRRELKSFEEKITAEWERNEQEIQGVSDHSKHAINRYENFTATASTVLASNDEWTDAQCLPDITAASEPLIRDVKKEFKELDSLWDTKISIDLSLMFVDKVTITDQEESVVDLNVIKNKMLNIRGITSSRDGHIIITGYGSSGKYSHITVISRKGEIIRQDQIEEVARSGYYPARYCESLSQPRIATACKNNQVGIYDVCYGKYVKKDINDINISWPGYVTCLATDSVNSIYVGGNGGRDVLVFDDELNYHHTLTLPDMIQYPYDMTVHGNHLLVADYKGRRAYAVTMEGLHARLVNEFVKPNLDGADWSPLSVCTDSNRLIYMLWQHASGCMLTQYSQDGHQLLAERVDGNAECLTTLKTDQGEKLLVATGSSAKLYTYGLYA